MLTQALLQPLLTGLSHTLSREQPDSTETAAALLESFHPESPIQAMLAAQAIALHHAAIDCFGRAMQAGEDDGASATRLQRNAASLTRAFTATLRTLQRCQGENNAEAARKKAMQREAGRGRGAETEAWDERFGDQATPSPIRVPQDEGESRPAPAYAPLIPQAPPHRPRTPPLRTRGPRTKTLCNVKHPPSAAGKN